MINNTKTMNIQNKMLSFIFLIFGHPKKNSMEHRVFNTFTFINAFLNIIGVLGLLHLDNSFIIYLQLSVGLFMLVFYYYSRVRSIYWILFWPYNFVLAFFIFFNSVGNAGSMGGAHYYFFVAMSISLMMSRSKLQNIGTIIFYSANLIALYYVESNHPELITHYLQATDRAADVYGNIIFLNFLLGGFIIFFHMTLNFERKKSENLLNNILPLSIAEELKKNDYVEPKNFDSVSVLFTDFVGFTKISENMSAKELVSELDSIFKEFDNVVAEYKLEKIKTIGDSYMIAGGIPIPDNQSPLKIGLVALKLKKIMVDKQRAMQEVGKNYWQMRIGIHTGPLIAGIIGQTKFSYDVWGDTVNTASRMESAGIENEINISLENYNFCKDYFEFEYRGSMNIKGKGAKEMYLLKRLKPEYSSDHNGYEANYKLKQMLS